MKTIIAGLAAATAVLAGTDARAGIVSYTGTVLNASTAKFGLAASRLFDQSGLSARYVDGVTDFAQYTASGVSHLGSSTTNGTGYMAAAMATVDIDLGQQLLVRSLALWNDNDAQGVRDFRLWIADDAVFTNPNSLGSFRAQYGSGNSFLTYSKGTLAQVFDLSDAAGRYVRIEFSNAHTGSNINVGELMFGGEVAHPVPVPGSLLLTGLGLLAMVTVRRRRRIA